MENRLCCGECGKVMKYKEQVFLDIMNTVIHKKCYRSSYQVKDRGTLKEIIYKYPFFHGLQPNLTIVK